MPLEFLHRPATPPGAPPPARIALFPGSWNPPTIAHLDIARAAASWADEIILVVPRAFPHKAFHGAAFPLRCEILSTLAAAHSARSHPAQSQPARFHQARLSAAISEGGLYADIATEARAHFGPAAELAILCGRDAAERWAAWPYPEPDHLARMLRHCRLLVAARCGEYTPPPEHRDRISTLNLPVSHDDVSSTDVRHRIEQNLDWHHLVPPAIHALLRTSWPARNTPDENAT